MRLIRNKHENTNTLLEISEYDLITCCRLNYSVYLKRLSIINFFIYGANKIIQYIV